MSVRISGSVGSYESWAQNLPADVRTVQELLTQAAKNARSPEFDPKGVDGKIARPGGRSGTVAAITAFQRQQVGMPRPDQRVDVGGGTWKKLAAVAEAAGPKPPAAAPPPVTLTVAHGGLIPTATKFNTASRN